MVYVVKEFEEKLSSYYGTTIILTTVAMDVWLCSNDREIDNVILCLEVKNAGN